MFFSMLFWAFFEQAGSSINNFTDRNVDRVIEARTVTTEDVGKAIDMRVPLRRASEQLAALPPLTQEQLGRRNGDAAATSHHDARRPAREGTTATDAHRTGDHVDGDLRQRRHGHRR